MLGRQVGQDHVQVQLWDVAGDVQQQQAWPVLSKVRGAGRCLHKQGAGRVDALQRERAVMSHVTKRARCLCRDASAAQRPATEPACAAQVNPAQLRQRMTGILRVTPAGRGRSPSRNRPAAPGAGKGTGAVLPALCAAPQPHHEAVCRAGCVA